MNEVHRSIEIDAPAMTVWALLQDVRRMPDLSPSTVAVEQAPDRLDAVGQTFDQTVTLAGKRFTSTWRVTALDPGRSLRVEGSVLPGTRYSMTETVVPLDGDRSRLDLDIAYKLPFGPLGKLAGRLGAERRALDEAEQVLDGIRRLAEAESLTRARQVGR